MNEIRIGELSNIALPEYKSSLVYGNIRVNLTKKPNLFMRLFLKLLGVEVE